jgi:hypothetical protein
MTLIIQKPTGAKLVMRKGWQPMDTDAAAYITAVETADGQALEERTKIAIDNFVLGCKQDGIWSAIKASCILAGARTLAGSLVPLVGTAPTNFNFVSGDYNRKTGLVGNGSTKRIDSNRNSNIDPQNSHHLSVYATTSATSGIYMSGEASGNRNGLYANGTAIEVPLRSGGFIPFTGIARNSTGLIAGSRISSSIINTRVGGSNVSISNTSASPPNQSINVFCQNVSGSTGEFVNARLAFYSIGESLDLALLDARVTDLINAFAAAIP